MRAGVLQSGIDFLSQNRHRNIANLIEMELPTSPTTSVTSYFTDYQNDLVYKGNTYVQGKIKSISEYEQSTELTSQQISLVMTGLDIFQLSIFLANGHSLQNKKVLIHLAYLDNQGQVVPFMSGDYPQYTWFKGNIQGGNIQDKRDQTLGESTITWTLTNDFYDFERVAGRFTSDASHRALITGPDGTLVPSGQAKKPQYSDDTGFFHSDKSIQILAQYQAQEKQYRMKTTKKKGLRGLIGMKNVEMEEYYATVTKEVDLSFNLAAKYLPVLYGTQVTGGIPVFADTEQDNPNTVWVVYALCEGEIEGILDIHIDDKPIICIDDQDDEGRVCFGRKKVMGDTINKIAVDANGNPVEGSNGPSVHGQSYILKDDDGEIQFWVYHGLPNQQASSVLVSKAQAQAFYWQKQNGIGSEYWDNNYRLLDTQYVVMKVQITENRSNIPDVLFEVKGRKIKTYNDQLVPNSSKSSSNLSWQILDYCTAVFGQGIPLSDIDLPSFLKVAKQYDIIDTSYDVSWVPYWRYLNWENSLDQKQKSIIQTNFVVDTQQGVFDCLNDLLTQGNQSLPVFHGKYYLTQEIESPQIQHIDLDQTLGGNIKITDSTGRTKYNTVSAGISDPANMWNQISVTFYDSNYMQEDNMKEKKLNLTFNGITNYYTARSMAARELKKSRYSRQIENIRPDWDLFYLLPNDPITLSYSRYNFDKKKFFVESITMSSRGGLDLVVKEYEDNIFINSPQVDNSDNQTPSINTNVLPPRNVKYTPHTTVQQGQVNLNGVLSWEPSLTAGVLYYTILQSGRVDEYIVDASGQLALPLIELEEGNYVFEVRQNLASGLRSKPQVLTTYINPAKSLQMVTGFRATNQILQDTSQFYGGYLDLVWDKTPDEALVVPLYYVLEFYNSNNVVIRSLRISKLYQFTYLLQDMKQDYRNVTGQLGVYRAYNVRIRAEGQHGEQSVNWTYLE